LIISNNKALKLGGDLFGVRVPLPDFSSQDWTAGQKNDNNSSSISALKRNALKHERGGRVNASAA
jgi:hypothetical protein